MASKVFDDDAAKVLFKNDKCYLCLDTYNDPRLLACYHSFCLNCLREYLNTFHEDFIECPLCDEKTTRPTSAKSLKKNIYLQLNVTYVGVSCSICGERELARAHCIECNQDFCRGCLKSHGGINATREHHLIKVGNKNLPRQVNRDVYCEVHPDEKMVYFCVQCEQLICKHCNVTVHKNHESQHSSEVAKFLRSQLAKTSDSREHKNYLMWLAERQVAFSAEVEKCKTLEKQCIQEIIDRTDQVVAIIKEIKHIMIKKTMNIIAKKTNPLKEEMSLFEKYIHSFAEILQHSHSICKTADDVEIVDSAPKITRILDDMKHQQSYPELVIGGFCVFKAGTVTADQLLPFFGDVLIGDEMRQCTKRKMYEFYTENSDTVMSMIPQADQRVWIVEGGSGDLKLYDNSGRVHKRIELGFNTDDLYATDEHIFVSGNSSKVIKVFDKNFNEVASINTELCSRGITVDPDDKSIYICLTEKNAFFDHDPTHKNKIVRIMPKGKRYVTHDVLSFSGNPTVEYPARIAITKNGRIAVSDWKRNCITMLNTKGYIDNEYFYVNGGNISPRPCPRGICADKAGNVYIADYHNNRILKLNEETGNVHVLLNEQDNVKQPWSVAFGNDCLLWVGSKGGMISAYYFKRPDHI